MSDSYNYAAYMTLWQGLSDTLSDTCSILPHSWDERVTNRLFVTQEMEKACDESQAFSSDGGGGNRTRVPRHFRASFYERSRMFGFRRREPRPTEFLGG